MVPLLLASAFLLYGLAGYPLLITLAARVAGRRPALPRTGEAPATMSVIIPARNESAGIAAKLENTLAAAEAYRLAGGSVQVIVGSDASDDDTDSIVRAYADRGIELCSLAARQGKEAALIRALGTARGDVIVMTDVKTSVAADALVNLGRHFADPAVGAVSSVDEIGKGSSLGERAYVGLEIFLRRQESRLGALIGLSGSFCGARREICRTLTPDVTSDFWLGLAARSAGYRAIQAEDIACRYGTVASERDEYRRKVRTVLHGMTTLGRWFRSPLRSTDLFLLWQLMSHKLFRWLVPFAAAALILGIAVVLEPAIVLSAFAAAAAVSALLCLAARGRETSAAAAMVRVGAFLILSNAAILSASWHYFQGRSVMMWEPSRKRSAGLS